MCFSITASFTASAVLIPIGFYAIYTALKHNYRYILVACVPLIFGIQQFTEGLVWYGLQSSEAMLTHYASLTYLFFAFFWWPAFIPLALSLVEEKIYIRRCLFFLFVLGLALGINLYLPILTGKINFNASIVNHSIDYQTYQKQPLIGLQILFYIAILSISFFISSFRKINYLGLLILVLFIISFLLYLVTFTSVWCFFSAVISAFVIYVIQDAKK